MYYRKYWYEDENNDEIKVTGYTDFNGYYFTIPVGFRFSLAAFTLGSGLTGNFPVSCESYTWGKINKQDSDESETISRREDIKFHLDPYIGWYFDIGFDLSGRRNRKGGFGMLARLNGSFTNIGGTTQKYSEYDPFRYFAVSLVFQAAIELANTSK